MRRIDEEHREFGELIHDVSRLHHKAINQAFAPLGLTRSQWWVLTHLPPLSANGLTQGELAKLLPLGPVTLGGLIDRLERAGFVQRRRGHRDRRVKHVVLTAAGTELLERAGSIAAQVEREMVYGIRDDELSGTGSTLQQMRTQIMASAGGATAASENSHLIREPIDQGTEARRTIR